MRRRPASRCAPAAILVLAAVAALLAACGPVATPVRRAATPAPATVAPGSSGGGAPAGAALPESVSVARAAALRDAGAFVLDVRQPEEWAVVRIPGAVLIPLDELPGRVAEVPRDRDVVVVCHSGNRSRQGRDILRAAGYDRVTSMTGGVAAWQAAGLPTEGS